MVEKDKYIVMWAVNAWTGFADVSNLVFSVLDFYAPSGRYDTRQSGTAHV